jgi:hypothetical protein
MVAVLPGGQVVTGGEDGRVLVWSRPRPAPDWPGWGRYGTWSVE